MFDATWLRGGRWSIVALAPGELPTRPDLARYMEAAAALESVGQADAARAAYAAAVDHWPREPLPRLGLANVAAAQGRWNEAERGYYAVLELDPRSAAAVNNRAEALARLGCHVEARTALERGAAQVDPADPLRPALERTLRELAQRAAAVTGPEPPECGVLGAR